MTLETLMNIIGENKKGTIRTLETVKELKVKKGCTDSYTKETVLQGRLGVIYDNMGKVIEMRESGELPSENAGLPWGVWKMFPYLIENKGKLYLRVSTANGNKTISKYYKNGIEISKEQAQAETLASNWSKPSDKPITVMTYGIENIISIK